MREAIRNILERCPTHGFSSDMAHMTLCPNQDHRELLAAMDELDAEFGYSSEITVECPECGHEFEEQV